MKTLTLFLSALMLWGYSLSAAADPSCEGRFVNPITDVCWRCIFPLSLGSVQVGKGDLPDTSNPGSPLQLCPAPPPIFVRPGLAIGYWEPMAMTDVSRSPGCMVNLGGFSINLGKTGTEKTTLPDDPQFRRQEEAIQQVASERLQRERLQAVERDMVRDLNREKTLGGD